MNTAPTEIGDDTVCKTMTLTRIALIGIGILLCYFHRVIRTPKYLQKTIKEKIRNYYRFQELFNMILKQLSTDYV